MMWDGTQLYTQQRIDTRGESIRSWITAGDLYIDGSIIMDADGAYHSLTGCSEVRGPSLSSRWSAVQFFDGASEVCLLTARRNSPGIGNQIDMRDYYDNIFLYAVDGDIRLRTAAASTSLYIVNWKTTGGRWGLGEITVAVGATTRTVNFDT